jgi:methylmalonyl-CoA/ethylmalonyl-CoA epimerase
MITGLSHVSIAVPSLEQAASTLREVYGLEVGPPQVNEEQGVRLAYVELGNARIELMEPAREGSPVAKFLERNPAGGIHHFCLEVDDVAATAASIAAKGARVLGEGRTQCNVHGRPIAFVHPKDFLGALVELEQTARDEARDAGSERRRP